MIQQRVQVWLLLVFFSVSTIAMGNSFPDILVQKDGSEVRGTLLEKKADGSGTFQKFNGELLEFRAETVTYVGPATRPNAEPHQAKQPRARTLNQSTNPHRLDQYPRRCHV